MAMPRFLACSRKLPASAEKRRCAMLSLAWKAGKHLAIGLKGLPRRAAVALGSPGLGEPARPDRLWKATALPVPLALRSDERCGGNEWVRPGRSRGPPLT